MLNAFYDSYLIGVKCLVIGIGALVGHPCMLFSLQNIAQDIER